jgi:hypothetical protein
MEAPPTPSRSGDLGRRLGEISFSLVVGALVFSVLSWFLLPELVGLGVKLLELGLVLGLVAVIGNSLGAFSPNERRQSQAAAPRPARNARAGIVLGAGAIVIPLLFFAAMIFILFAIVAGAQTGG